MNLKFLNNYSYIWANFKKYKSYYMPLIICVLIIFYFIIQIYSNIHTNKGDILTVINTMYTSLILGGISLIAVIISSLNNKKILEQNEKSRFIELRFKDTKNSIYYLKSFLWKTIVIHKQLSVFCKLNENIKSISLPPRSFLIMQFINLINDENLLKNLPISLSDELQNKFEDRELNYGTNIPIEEDLYISSPKKDAHLNFIKAKNEYFDFIKQFNENNFSEHKKNVFKAYILSDISEDEILLHFKDFCKHVTSKSIEELILEDFKN